MKLFFDSSALIIGIIFLFIFLPTNLWSQYSPTEDLFVVGIKLYNEQKYEECIRIFEECLEKDKSLLQEEDERLCYPKQWIASAYNKLNKPEKAKESFYLYYMDPIDRTQTKVSDSIATLVNINLKNNNINNALIECEKCAKARREELGDFSLWYAHTLQVLATLYFNKQDYEESFLIFKNLVSILSKYKHYDDNYYHVLKFYCASAFNCNMISEAMSIADERINIARTNNNDIELGNAYIDKANMYYLLEKYSQCIDPQEYGIEALKMKLGNNHIKVIEQEHSFVDILEKNMQYSKAAHLLEDIIYRDVDPSGESTDSIIITNKKKLINLLQKANELDRAIMYQEQIIDYKKSHDINLDYANEFFTLSHLNYDNNQKTQALDNLNECKKIFEQIGDTMSISFISILKFSIEIHLSLNIKEEAENIQKRAIAICNNSSILRNSDIYKEILSCVKKTIDEDIVEQLLYPVVNIMNNHNSELEPIKYRIAVSNIDKLISVTNQRIREEFSHLNLDYQKQYWEMYRHLYENEYPKIADMINDSILNSELYDAILLSKGILLSSEISLKDCVYNSRNTIIKEKYKRLTAKQKQLSKQTQSHSNKNKFNTEKLKFEIRELQKEILAEIRGNETYLSKIQTRMYDVQEKLKEEDAAIEFIQYSDDNSEIVYLALILTPNKIFPKLVKLTTQSKILNDWDYSNVNSYKKIYELIWEPIISLFPHITTIYFSPTGILNCIPIENALEKSNNSLSQRIKLYRLSSTKELAFPSESYGENAYIFGNVDYQTNSHIPKKRDKIIIPNKKRDIYRYGIVKLQPLEGTKCEIDSICSILNTQYKYEGKFASEKKFNSISRQKPQIIHLATHGIYLKKNENLYNKYMDFVAKDFERESLSRCALYLAGAEKNLNNSVFNLDSNDGILTAYEISQLDFKGLDLVSLSSCESGLGDITGDGVWGLQRGFKKAGAKSILISLWKVDDEATSFLMTEFYRNYSQLNDKYASFEIAKNKVKQIQKWDNPEFWSSFILIDAL